MRASFLVLNVLSVLNVLNVVAVRPSVESSWNPFASPCETVKCNGEHYWTGYDLTYSNCKLELEWENGKQGPGMYKSDGKVVKPSQINVLGFCPGNEDCDLPEGGGYVCRERCDIHRNPKVVKGKKTKPADAKGTMVYRTGKANDGRDPPLCVFLGASFY